MDGDALIKPLDPVACPQQRISRASSGADRSCVGNDFKRMAKPREDEDNLREPDVSR